MNKFEKIFIGVVLFGLLFDLISTVAIYLAGLGHLESNPLKVFFGDYVLWVGIVLSIAMVFLFRNALLSSCKNNFQRGILMILIANFLFLKVLAGLGNLLISANSAEYVEVTYTSTELVWSYVVTVFSLLVSPFLFNVLFFWIFWKWFVEPKLEKKQLSDLREWR